MIGTGSGSATLMQNGSSVSGTVQEGGVTWAIQGAIQGNIITLAWSAPGQVQVSDSGTLSADGSTISDNYGAFSGHATCG